MKVFAIHKANHDENDGYEIDEKLVAVFGDRGHAILWLQAIGCDMEMAGHVDLYPHYTANAGYWLDEVDPNDILNEVVCELAK